MANNVQRLNQKPIKVDQIADLHLFVKLSIIAFPENDISISIHESQMLFQ